LDKTALFLFDVVAKVKGTIVGYLGKIAKCNNFSEEGKLRFVLDGKSVGYVREEFVAYLLKSNLFVEDSGTLTIAPKYQTRGQREKALDSFAQEALRDGITNIFMQEPYPVLEDINSEPICLADRSISTLLGLISFGQLLNGYVKSEDGMKMWIGRRSHSRGYEAGKLDHIVAGGLPYGISLEDNLVKECYEEAGMSRELALKAVPVGVVSYKHEYDLGGKQDIIYCYDLELPKSFIPQCKDGEVEEFYLLDIKEVANIVKNSDEFKLNCNLVIIDFLLRHGYLKPEEKDYIDIARGLRR